MKLHFVALLTEKSYTKKYSLLYVILCPVMFMLCHGVACYAVQCCHMLCYISYIIIYVMLYVICYMLYVICYMLCFVVLCHVVLCRAIIL